jgi:hypothetical protein
MRIYYLIGILLFVLTCPISFPLFFILNYFNIINDIYADGFSTCYYTFDYRFRSLISKINYWISPESPTSKDTFITFINPYIKFLGYPSDWNWVSELIRPQPSPFVETITVDIYSTFNGESLINFKWNLYGKYYYAFIWVMFTALLGCFTAATSISTNILPLTNDNKWYLLIASITLGFIHLFNDIRQFLFNPGKWIRDPWNYFGKSLFIINV